MKTSRTLRRTPTRFPRAVLVLPAWVGAFLRKTAAQSVAAENRMPLVIRLAEMNVERGAGGPFAAAVFEIASGRLVSAGVNRVEALGCSICHAEIMALALAQRASGTHDLGDPACELVTSAEPCAMCMGAIPWSGVRRVVCGARGADVCAVGFDEGAKPLNWEREYASRGIAVQRDVCRAEAVAVLKRYVDNGGTIYNARNRTS
jgi:tRNA(Arg) A34 adenosine deaminase TadA